MKKFKDITANVKPFLGERIEKIKSFRSRHKEPETGAEENGRATSKDMASNEDELKRSQWGRKLDYLMTAIGHAVGLGNVWRFPFLCYKNGGAAFLIPYVLALAFVGIPIYYLEVCLGQFASLGPISVWNISPLFRGIGYIAVFMASICSIYYPVIIAYCIHYLGNSFRVGIHPWATCNNWWNTPNCESVIVNETKSSGKNAKNNSGQVSGTSSVEEFYKHRLLRKSPTIDDYGTPSWDLSLTLLACWIVVCLSIVRGIKSLSKVAYFFTVFPYIMLTIMLCFGLTLEGSGDGIRFYIANFDHNKLTKLEVWIEALTQIFFSLGIGTGSLITLASFNKFNNKCRRDIFIICITNSLTSLITGFAVFASLGHLAKITGKSIEDVVAEGFGLSFIAYPFVLSRMKGSAIWSVLFFSMLVCIGLGSHCAVFEGILAGIQDELSRIGFLKNRKSIIKYRICMCMLFFLLGLPLICPGGPYMITAFDEVIAGYPLLLVLLCEVIVVCFIYGLDNFSRDIQVMEGKPPNWLWLFIWRYLDPIILFIVIICSLTTFFGPKYDGDYKLPYWYNVFRNLLAGSAPLLFIVVFFYVYLQGGGIILLREMAKPVYNWGPANRPDRIRFLKDVCERRLMIKTPAIEIGDVLPITLPAVTDQPQQQSMGAEVTRAPSQMGEATSELGSGGGTGGGLTASKKMFGSMLSLNRLAMNVKDENSVSLPEALVSDPELVEQEFFQSKLTIAEKLAEAHAKEVLGFGGTALNQDALADQSYFQSKMAMAEKLMEAHKKQTMEDPAERELLERRPSSAPVGDSADPPDLGSLWNAVYASLEVLHFPTDFFGRTC